MLVAMGPGPGTNNLQEALEEPSGFTHTLTSATTVHMCNSSYSVKYHGYIHGVLTISTACV